MVPLSCGRACLPLGTLLSISGCLSLPIASLICSSMSWSYCSTKLHSFSNVSSERLMTSSSSFSDSTSSRLTLELRLRFTSFGRCARGGCSTNSLLLFFCSAKLCIRLELVFYFRAGFVSPYFLSLAFKSLMEVSPLLTNFSFSSMMSLSSCWRSFYISPLISFRAESSAVWA